MKLKIITLFLPSFFGILCLGNSVFSVRITFQIEKRRKRRFENSNFKGMKQDKNVQKDTFHKHSLYKFSRNSPSKHLENCT